MNKKLKQLKLELLYWRKCIFKYHKFWRYIYNKYILARKILKLKKVLEQPVNNHNLSIHILTCHRDLIMTLWSLVSFYKMTDSIGQLYIHNDGSLNKKDKQTLKEFFPSAKIIEPQNFLSQYQNELNQYPVVKKFRTQYPQYFLLKKLIDPYFASSKKYHLIIDSDLLWFKNPIEIEQVIKNSCQNSLMTTNNRLTYAFAFFKDGSKSSPQSASYNSGIVLYHKDNFSLEKLLDYFKKIDIQHERNQHFIEQIGYTVCLKNLKKLPLDKYIIEDKVNHATIVKHYTSVRRPLFYIEGLEILKNKFL